MSKTASSATTEKTSSGWETTLSIEERSAIHQRKEGHLPHETVEKTLLGKAIEVVGTVLEELGLYSISFGIKDCIALSQDLAEDIPELGDQKGVTERLKLFFSEIDEKFMPNCARLGLGSVIKRGLQTRLDMFNYVRAHPEIRQIKLKPMVVITGLPRTGTTLLQNLLCSNQRSRCLRLWEYGVMGNCFPPAKSKEQSVTDPRIAECNKNFFKINNIYKNYWEHIWQSHYMAPLIYDEDSLIHLQTALFVAHAPLATLGEKYNEDYFATDALDTYQYIKLYYQAQQYGYSPVSHWVNKAPHHSLFLHSLNQTMPDARVVFTHRSPVFTIPSFAALIETFVGQYFPEGEYDRRKCGQFALRSVKVMTERMIEFQKKVDPKLYINIKFEETVSDPLMVVKRIHGHFKLEYCEEDAKSVSDYLVENPRGKHGNKKYSPEQFGFTTEQIEAEFAEYIKDFC